MDAKQDKAALDNVTIKELKIILSYIKAARKSDHITYRAIMTGDDFKKIVINPLEKITGWNEKDEENIAAISEEAKKETSIKERNESIKRGLKIGGVLAGLSIAGGIAAYLLKKRKKRTEK